MWLRAAALNIMKYMGEAFGTSTIKRVALTKDERSHTAVGIYIYIYINIYIYIYTVDLAKMGQNAEVMTVLANIMGHYPITPFEQSALHEDPPDDMEYDQESESSSEEEIKEAPKEEVPVVPLLPQREHTEFSITTTDFNIPKIDKRDYNFNQTVFINIFYIGWFREYNEDDERRFIYNQENIITKGQRD